MRTRSNLQTCYAVGLAIVMLTVIAGCTGHPGSGSATPFIPLTNARVDGPARYHRRIGDIWANTWADDGQLYMAFGDGTGLGNCCLVVASDSDYQQVPGCDPIPSTTSIKQIFDPSGGATVCDGTNNYCTCRATPLGVVVLGQDPAAPPADCEQDCLVTRQVRPTCGVPGCSDKPSSMLSVDGTLYLAGHTPLGDPDIGWIAFSRDHGLSWTEVPGTPWQRPGPYRVMMFIQMGQDYSLNTDGYVYALGMGAEIGWSDPNGGLGKIYLARVPKDRIADYSAWEYLDGVTGGQPSWSSNPADGVPVEGLASGLQGASIYHPETNSYLFICNNDPGGLYQAEHPWGPWKLVSTLFQPGQFPDGWLHDWGPLMGLVPMGTGRDHVYFTNASDAHYGLTIGTLRLQ